MTTDTKPTNPKDAIGTNKLPYSVVPSTMRTFAALGMLEGACKYGRYNYRAVGVRASVYYDAFQRHVESWWNGEDTDPATGIPHLASALSCIAIILDADVIGKLTDDRPPRSPIGDLIRTLSGDVPRIKELFKDHEPHQYTIADSAPVERQFAFELMPDEVESTFFPLSRDEAHADGFSVAEVARAFEVPASMLTPGDHDEATALARLHERVRATEESANG